MVSEPPVAAEELGRSEINRVFRQRVEGPHRVIETRIRRGQLNLQRQIVHHADARDLLRLAIVILSPTHNLVGLIDAEVRYRRLRR